MQIEIALINAKSVFKHANFMHPVEVFTYQIGANCLKGFRLLYISLDATVVF